MWSRTQVFLQSISVAAGIQLLPAKHTPHTRARSPVSCGQRCSQCKRGKKASAPCPVCKQTPRAGRPCTDAPQPERVRHTLPCFSGVNQVRHRPEAEIKYTKSMHILNLYNIIYVFYFSKVYICIYSHFPAELIIYFWFILVPSTHYKINIRSHSPVCTHHQVPFRTTSPK